MLERLLEVFDEHPEVGICGCRLVREDGSFDHAVTSLLPDRRSRRSATSPASAARRSASARLAAYRAPDVDEGVVDAVNGAFMLMRRAALDEVGLFDEGYWMYMEDLDLCYRFREAGWSTWYEPSVVASHAKGGSSGPVRSPRLNYAFHYGMFRFYRKHYARRSAAALNALVYAGIFGKLLVSWTRNGLRTSLPSVLRRGSQPNERRR